jgi:hypothetical protein
MPVMKMWEQRASQIVRWARSRDGAGRREVADNNDSASTVGTRLRIASRAL